MSHFTVLVIGPNPEEQLAPYQENNMGDCPEQYMAFTDKEPECKEEYENNTISRVKIEGDDKYYTPYDKKFRVEITQEEYEKAKENKEPHLGSSSFGETSYYRDRVYPENAKVMDVPFKELYSTLENFIEEYHGYSKDEKTGKYGYWENPQAKWDWYQLGGRWTGFFIKKDGGKGIAGSPGVFGKAAEAGRIDQGIKADIDFDAMYNEAADKATLFYDEVAKLFGGTIPRLEKSWSDLWDDHPDGPREKIRELYDAQEGNKILEELEKKAKENQLTLSDTQKEFLTGFYMGGGKLDSFMCTRDEYIGRAMANSVATFAVLKDGKWYEKGQMGWWAMVANEKEEKQWHTELMKLINESPDDTLFSVFDCHI